MNPTIQSGMHPDADMLTAFAEQLMTAEEREQMLAHMATCSRCREVMFLAQQAAGAEALTAPAGATEPAKKTRAGWLGDWRWAWIPAGALAMLIGVAALMHFSRVERETQMARNAPASEALQQASPAPTAGSAQPADKQLNAVRQAKAPAERDQAPAKQEEELKALDDERRVGRREASAVSKLGAVAPSIAISSGFVGGSAHGAMTARGKDSSYGGPAANQLQQNANQQNAALQNQLQSVRSLDEAAANKPAAVAGGSVGAASETVTVQAEAVAPASPAKPAPAPAPQVPSVPMSGRSFDVSSGAMANLKKAPKIVLPGGGEALSSASAAGRTIAIDTSGALFLSLDNGKSWQPVTTQWTGRAVLVRNSPGSSVADAAKVDRLQGVPEVRFELVTDKLQTWTSADGKTWIAEMPPAK